MIWLFILLVVIAIVCCAGACYMDEWNGFLCGWICLGCVILAIIVGCCIWLPSPKRPSAMDVYSGKTTLEITYRDSVAIDSVVVFKNEYKEE